MSILLRLVGTVSFAASTKPKVHADVFFEEQVSPVRTIYADVSFDTNFREIINGAPLPTGGDEVLSTWGRPCVLRLWFSDFLGNSSYLVVPHHSIHNFEFTDTLGSGISWSITLEDLPAFRETGWLGPAPGTKSISLDGGYLSGNNYVYVRLMTNGIVNSSSRTVSRKNGDLITLTGVGPEGRYDCVKVDYSFPPGHGMNAAQQIRRLCIEAGIPYMFNHFGYPRRYKPLQINDENALTVIRELADSINRAVVFNRNGYLTLVPITGIGDVYHVLTEHNVVESGNVSVNAEGNVFTRIVVTGTSQPTSDSCGIVTKQHVVDTYDNYFIPKHSYYVQQSSGTLANSPTYGVNRDARRELIKRVIVTQEYACDTMISERVETYEWYAPPTARYQIDDTSGGIVYVTPYAYIYDPDAAKDDNAPAYFWYSFKFVKTSDVLTIYNFTDEPLDGGKWIADTPVGSLIATEVFHGGWRQRKAALEGPRSVGGAWGSLFIVDRYLLASGEGVWDQTAYWCCSHGSYTSSNGWNQPSDQYLKYTVTIYDLNDKGYVLSEITTEAGDYPWPGYKYRYHGTVESNEEYEGDEEFPGASYVYDVRRWLSTIGVWYGLRPQREDHTVYIANDIGTSHKKISSWHTYDEITSGSTIENQDGYLPAAEFRWDLLPPDSVYFDEDEMGGRAVASPSESQDFIVEFSVPALECCHMPCETSVSNDLIESEDEAEAFGKRILMEGSAYEVAVPLFFDITKEPGKLVHVQLKNQRMNYGHGLNHDMTIKQVTHSKNGVDSPLLTTITGKIYTFG